MMPDVQHQPAPEFIPTRRSLITRLKQWEDQESWRDFFNTYWRLVYGFALKSGLSATEAQEVVQETVISVAKKMPGFKYNPAVGSFKGWLLQVTRRRIADQFRKRPKESAFHNPPSGLSTRTSPSARIADPASLELDAVWEQEWQHNLMDTALGTIKKKVAPRQYQLFELYVLKEWPVERITSTLGVSPGQVYLSKVRVRKLLEKEVKRLELQESERLKGS